MREYAYEGPMVGPIVEMSRALDETQMFEAIPTRTFDFGPTQRNDALFARWGEHFSRRHKCAKKETTAANANPVATEFMTAQDCECTGHVDGEVANGLAMPFAGTAVSEFPARCFDCAADIAAMAEALKPPCPDGGEEHLKLFAAPFRLDGGCGADFAGQIAMVVWWDDA